MLVGTNWQALVNGPHWQVVVDFRVYGSWCAHNADNRITLIGFVACCPQPGVRYRFSSSRIWLWSFARWSACIKTCFSSGDVETCNYDEHDTENDERTRHRFNACRWRERTVSSRQPRPSSVDLLHRLMLAQLTVPHRPQPLPGPQPLSTEDWV